MTRPHQRLLWGFPAMDQIVPEGEHGTARVSHHRISEFEAMSAIMRGQYTEAHEPLAVLSIHGACIMSDSQFERMTNHHVLKHARGDVLIAGLGLGMVLHPLLAMPEVTSVSVVEKNADIITLIAPTLLSAKPRVAGAEKLWIVEGDIFTWVPGGFNNACRTFSCQTGRWSDVVKFDAIYFDIWPHICSDQWEEMKALTARARSWRKKGAWVDCWMKQRHQTLASADRERWPT